MMIFDSEIVKKIQRECDEAAHSCMVIVTVGGGVLTLAYLVGRYLGVWG